MNLYEFMGTKTYQYLVKHNIHFTEQKKKVFLKIIRYGRFGEKVLVTDNIIKQSDLIFDKSSYYYGI